VIEVLRGGLLTTVQDYPGRVGYWHIGIPPSGPLDSLAFRIANRLVGNQDGDAGLEITALGPKLRFGADALIALTGAQLKATLDDSKEVPWWRPISVEAGATLTLGSIEGGGYRTYLTVSGGLDVPDYLGSKSTFVMGGFGGHQGRALEPGDVLKVGGAGGKTKSPAGRSDAKSAPDTGAGLVPSGLVPDYGSVWELATVPGPHSAPDFFTDADVEMFFATDWKVHHNSNRFGYRLQGPEPKFARKDGGEGGHHPSNLLDCAYAVGTVNFTGTLPVILAVDGPSLGGFVSLATVASSERWKIGQARPGDTIRFRPAGIDEVLALRRTQEDLIARI